MTGDFPEALKQGRTAMPHQKRRAAAVGKWHIACPEVRLYSSEVSGEKGIAPLRAYDNIGVPFGAGKDCYCSQGVGAGDKKEWR